MRALLLAPLAALLVCGCQVKIKTHAAGPLEPRITREISWPGGDHIEIDLSTAEVVYVRADAPKITLEGAKGLVDEVEVDGDRIWIPSTVWTEYDIGIGESRRRTITIDGKTMRVDNDKPPLRVTVAGPSVTGFEIGRGERLVLDGYDLPKLHVEASGGSSVVGSAMHSGEVDLDLSGGARANLQGEAQSLKLNISGGARANLADLRLTDLDLRASGGSHATVAPTHLAQIDASGGSHTELTTSPERLVADKTGGAEIELPN